MSARPGVLLKLASDIDPLLYIAGSIAVSYLLILAFVNWKRNYPDQWQKLLSKTGVARLQNWAREKWNAFRHLEYTEGSRAPKTS